MFDALGRIWDDLRPHRKLVYGAALVSPLAALTEALAIAALLLLGQVVAVGAPVTHTFLGVRVEMTLEWAAVGAIATIALRCAALAGHILVQERLVEATVLGMRVRLVKAYQSATWSVASLTSHDRIQTLVTSHLVKSRRAIRALPLAIKCSAIAIGLLVCAAFISPVTAGLVLAMALLLYGLVLPIAAHAARQSSNVRRDMEEVGRHVSEAALLRRETQALGVTEQAIAPLQGRLRSLSELNWRTQIELALIPVGFLSAALLLLVIGLIVGARAASVSGPGVVGALLLMLRVLQQSKAAQSAMSLGIANEPYLASVREQIRLLEEAARTSGAAPAEPFDTLTYTGVSFAHVPEQPIVVDFDLAVRRGEVVGLVGPTGRGKSTLLGLALGLLRPDAGDVRINGRHVTDYSAESLARIVGFVPQECRLLNASLADNIAFFRDVSREAIERAAHMSALDVDIARMPHGYETEAGALGSSLSGGQRQRLALARALVSDPDLLLLDEVTSALDASSEQAICATLDGLRAAGKTILLVAHRGQTLDLCDRLVDLGETSASASATATAGSAAVSGARA